MRQLCAAVAVSVTVSRHPSVLRAGGGEGPQAAAPSPGPAHPAAEAAVVSIVVRPVPTMPVRRTAVRFVS